MITLSRYFIAPLIMLCLLAACSSEPMVDEEWFAEEIVSMPEQKMPVLKPKPKKSVARTAATSDGILTTLSPSAVNRKLIKEASLYIEVDNAIATAQSISQMATAAGGYIADTSRQTFDDEQVLVTMSVRIPTEKFDALTEGFQSLGTVLTFTSSAQDVTEEYFDTESRARNLKLSEERLLDHLSRSAKLEDILKAEKEITRVRGQIEQLEGRLRFLGNRVDFSTVSIQLQDKPGAQQILPKKSYSMQHVASNASRSLIAFGQQLLTLGIWVLVWMPIWLPMVIVGVVGCKRMWAKK